MEPNKPAVTRGGHPMSPTVAHACRQFMDRVQMTGPEAVAWLECVAALDAVAAAPEPTS